MAQSIQFTNNDKIEQNSNCQEKFEQGVLNEGDPCAFERGQENENFVRDSIVTFEFNVAKKVTILV